MKHKSFTFKSLDGLDVYGYLFYNSGTEPLFIEVPAGLHGGIKPNGKTFDRLQTSIARFLINNGFQVGFIDKRGSKGYSEDYMKQRDFCRKSVDDIIEGTKIILEKTGQENAIIHGTSSSATEALLAIVREPVLYRKAILTSGFYDIPKMVNYELKSRYFHPTCQLVEHLSPKEIDQINPMQKAHLVHPNIQFLLVHGKDDNVVPCEQSEILVNILRDNGADVTTLFYNSFTHTRKDNDPRKEPGRTCWSGLVNWINETKKDKF